MLQWVWEDSDLGAVPGLYHRAILLLGVYCIVLYDKLYMVLHTVLYLCTKIYTRLKKSGAHARKPRWTDDKDLIG